MPTTHHDFITGTSPDTTYQVPNPPTSQVWDSSGQLPMSAQAVTLATTAMNLGMEQLAAAVQANPLDANEIPVVVFNQVGCDLPDTALVEMARTLGLPMAYVRGAAKGHGRGRQIEGAGVEGRRVVLLEDTVSTGESVLAAAAALRAEGAELVRCVCIFTWGWQATTAAFADATLPLVSLTALPELLDVATAGGA